MDSSKVTDSPVYSPVCMIYSRASLLEIADVLDTYVGKLGTWSSLRIVRSRDKDKKWVDTNRTIVLVNEYLFNALVLAGLHLPHNREAQCEFRIVPYEVRGNNLPRQDSNKNFFIRLPNDPSFTSSVIEENIKEKIQPLVDYGILTASDYSIKIPMKNLNRSTGKVSKSCFVTFSDNVTEEDAALIKAVIDDTYWGKTTETFHCFWARNRPEKKKVPKKEPWE